MKLRTSNSLIAISASCRVCSFPGLHEKTWFRASWIKSLQQQYYRIQRADVPRIKGAPHVICQRCDLRISKQVAEACCLWKVSAYPDLACGPLTDRRTPLFSLRYLVALDCHRQRFRWSPRCFRRHLSKFLWTYQLS